MTVTQTSRDAYHRLNLSNQQKIVFTAMVNLEESCIADIAAYLRWEKSTVAGRLNELKKMELVVKIGKRKSDTTGITSEFWRIREVKQTLF